MRKFRTISYSVLTEKVQNDTIRCVCISDLHGICYGKKNIGILEETKKAKPDLILIPGDLVTKSNTSTIETAVSLLHCLKEIAPVFFVNGNHETALKEQNLDFENQAIKAGASILNNQSESLCIKGQEVRIYGLELDASYYGRFCRKHMTKERIEELLGEAPKEAYVILLAHSPAYFADYAEWGADLTVSGHYHGGFLRLPFLGGVISPQMRLFPKYSRGQYEKNKKTLIVSAGIGSHSMIPRINNPAELLVIDIERK